jgi:hypothetical protein
MFGTNVVHALTLLESSLSFPLPPTQHVLLSLHTLSSTLPYASGPHLLPRNADNSSGEMSEFMPWLVCIRDGGRRGGLDLRNYGQFCLHLQYGDQDDMNIQERQQKREEMTTGREGGVECQDRGTHFDVPRWCMSRAGDAAYATRERRVSQGKEVVVDELLEFTVAVVDDGMKRTSAGRRGQGVD